MKNFEYHVVSTKEEKTEDQESLLTAFGREGWKLVSVVKMGEQTRFYLIRKCEEC